MAGTQTLEAPALESPVLTLEALTSEAGLEFPFIGRRVRISERAEVKEERIAEVSLPLKTQVYCFLLDKTTDFFLYISRPDNLNILPRDY